MNGLVTVLETDKTDKGLDMAEDDVNEALEGENEDGEEGKKGGFNKKLLIILFPIILLAGGAGLYFTGVIGGSDETHVEGEEQAGEGDDTEEVALNESGEPLNAGFYALPDLIVNLSSNSGSRFLKMRVQLELQDETKIPELEAVTPRVIDQFQTYLREMRVEDLRGSAGIYRLRQELLYRVNIAAHPVKVTDVLFQEMLIQ